MSKTPEIPDNTQWCTFLRNHDELTLEMVTEEERQWMWDEYAPMPRMRLNLGIRRRLAPLLDNNHQKILLANALLYSLPGVPIVYYGDEIGMSDNIWLPDRNGVRTPMQWDDSLNAGFSDADPEKLYAPVIDTGEYTYKKVNVENESNYPDSLLNKMKHLIEIRKTHPVLAVGDYVFLARDQIEFLTILRKYKGENVLCVHNLTDEERAIKLPLVEFTGKRLVDIVNDQVLGNITEDLISLVLDPYGYHWIRII